MSEPVPEYPVEDNPWTWLAIYAENYAASDRLFRELTHSLTDPPGRRPLNPSLRRGVEAHREEVKHQRQAHYSALIARAMECESLRLGTNGRPTE